MQNKNKLGLLDFTMIMISFVIGMGIFRTPVNVAAQSPDTTIFFLAWVFGGLVALCGALTYAEIGSRYPITGGYYKIFSYAYHPAIAFGVNCIILISNAASLSGVALIGAEYISSVLFPQSADAKTIQIIIAIFCIAAFYGINLLGLKMSAKAQTVLTAVKIGMILMLILPIFFADSPASATSVQQSFSGGSMGYLKAFGLGLVAVSFTYGGYQQSINFGEEVREPARNIPRAIFMGIVVIILLYLLVNYAYIKVIGFQNLKEAKNISSIMASHLFGDAAGKVVSVLLFLSVLAYVNVVLMSNPRVMQAMGQDGVLPGVFAKRTKKNDVLFASLSVFAAAAIIIVFWAKTFDTILNFTIFLDSIGMALSAATIFKLRMHTKHLDNTGIYKMKAFPVMPVIFIATYTFVAINIFNDKPLTALLGVGILAAFVLLYFIIKPQGQNTGNDVQQR